MNFKLRRAVAQAKDKYFSQFERYEAVNVATYRRPIVITHLRKYFKTVQQQPEQQLQQILFSFSG